MEEAERGKDLQEALFSAIQEGDLRKVKDCAQLDAELKNKEGYTSLEWACYNGYEEIALFLIEGTAGQRFYTQSAFLHATEKGMIEVVTKLNQFASGNDIRFALEKACYNGNAEIAKLLIDTGVNVRDSRDEDGRGLLLLPCFHGYIKIAKLLINAGANPNGILGTYGDVPLVAASLNGHMEIAKLLVDAGANPNGVHGVFTCTYGDVPLLAASFNGHLEIAKLLIDTGADVNQTPDRLKFEPGPLVAACCSGHVEIAKLLVEAGAHVNADHYMKEEPLRGACCGGHLEIAKILVGAGAHVNSTNGRNNEGALWAACCNGHLEIAKLLINAGANPNMINEQEISTLQAARCNGHTEIAKLLIDAGAHEDKQPLWTACSDGHLEVAKLLIDAGADVNETHLDGKGPLWAACCAGHLKIVKLLIDAGADVNKKTKMFMKVPLYAACYYNHVEIVKLLINATADVNATDKYGAGPLVTACECNNIEIAKLLIDAGADVNKIANGKLPLEVAYYLGCSTEMVKILIDARADVNKTDEGYWNQGLLQKACFSGEVEFAKLLIDAGASVNKTDERQIGPLEEACSNGHMEIAKLLIDAGAIVNINKGFRRPEGPLYAACSNGHMEIAKLLIDAGANVNINKGLWRPEGPLYAACSNGHMEIVKLLIDAGADVNEIDITKMPLWAACSNGHMEIAKLLIDAGADAKIKIGDRELEPLLERPCSKGHVEFAKLLIDAGADVNATDKGGYGPLMRACYGGHIEIVILLLDAGADVDKTNLSKEGPLWAACSNGHVEIAKLLINAGADVNKTNRNNFSVLHAFMKSRPSVLSLNFLNLMLSRDFSLVGCCGKDNLLPHEYPCPTEVRQFLFESWVQYRYYELYSKGTTTPKRIKICVIGEGKAGKTTLIKTLQNTDWRKGGDNRRTTSMDVSMATIKSAGEVVFCDFAGQPYFHKTHGLFFSESTTAFLLVVDLKKSYSELHESSFYFCSFVKCSVGLTELKKAFVIVTGSRKDELSNLENGERKLRQLAVNLRQTYGRWLNIYEKYFVLNCRDRKANSLDLLKQAIAEVKMLVIERSKDVPLIVEAAVTSFLPTLRHPFQTPKMSPLRRIFRFLDSGESEETKEIREKTLSSLRKKFSIPQNKEDSHYNTHVMNACVFKQLLVDSLWPGLSDNVQDLLVEFLQGIGEIFAIGDKIILDPPWLCQNAIGPLLSPEGSPEFPISLQCSSPGTATKKQIQCALEAFNDKKWENIDETILLLCHLEICYPLLGEPDTYRFPARINEERPPDVWRENSEMNIYIGRRLRQAEETDIITPGTMPFLQCRVHNAACFRGLKPVIWKGGLMIHETIDGRSVEGMIRLQKKDKALDFVVRGPKHWEKECMKFLTNLKETGEKILRQKSPGTNSLYLYISSAELKQLKDFPLAYAEEKVDEKIKTSTKSHITVSEGTIKDSLKDLFALPDNHVDFLSYKTRRAIITCLEKDDAGRSTLREHLQGLSQADKVECRTAAMLLSTWSENLCATAESFADAARKSRLLYLLALLNEDGAIQLSTEKKEKAEKDLKFIRTSSPSLIKRRFAGTATNVEREGEDVTSLFGDEFLDAPMISLERFRAAQRIQPKWRSIGRILGPKPFFEHFEIHAFGEQRNDIDRALEMLDAWAVKFGTRATRRHFINALKDPDVGYSYEVAAIFSGPH